MNPPSMLELTQMRLGLLSAGFVPLPAIGKRVLLPGWNTLHVDGNEIQSWEERFPNWLNTGLRCATTPFLDVDILGQEAAEAIEALARERFGPRTRKSKKSGYEISKEKTGLRKPGRILVRVGQSPKRAIPFRVEAPFEKMSVHVHSPFGNIEKIEFLGAGQQIICFGVHPTTHQPYQWLDGAPGEVKRSELPRITQQQAAQFLVDAATLIERHGYVRMEQEPARTSNAKPPPRIAPEHADQETAEMLWAYLQLLNPDLPRERWFKIGCSCFSILGPTDGFDCWNAWSSTGVKYNPREMHSQWARDDGCRT